MVQSSNPTTGNGQSKRGGLSPRAMEAVISRVRDAKPFYESRDLTPEHLESLYTAGYSLYTSGRYKEACDIFRLLCIYDHTKVRNWMALGGAAQHTDNHLSAKAAFTMAVILDPLNPEPRMQAANSCIALKDLEGARTTAETVIDLCGDDRRYQTLKQRAEALRSAINDLEVSQ